MGDKSEVMTLKEWAYIAIAKHSRKMLKYEAKVLKDKDPENLHQMRVGMRRLRSAIAGFAVALDLPSVVNQKNIGKIGRCLGKLRDLDVLLATLDRDYRPLLPPKEQKNLDKVIKSLHKQRKKEVKQVRETLNSKLYLNLQQGLQNWLERPEYRVIGDLSIYPVLPNLLLPQVSQFLLHPGWLVGVELQEGKSQFPANLDAKAVEKLLERDEPILHDLRKLAKKTRYNLELFAQFYDDTYQGYIDQIEKIQEVLGQIQDYYVLRQMLEKAFGVAIAEQMPQLAALLHQARYQKWQQWQVLQKRFLDEQTQTELRQAIQQPSLVVSH